MTIIHTVPVTRTTTEGNLHQYRQMWVAYGRVTSHVLNCPGHFWIRQDGSVTIRHDLGSLKGAKHLRILAAQRWDGTVDTNVHLGAPADPVHHFLTTDPQASRTPLDVYNRVPLMRHIVRGINEGVITPEDPSRPLRFAYDNVNRLVGWKP